MRFIISSLLINLDLSIGREHQQEIILSNTGGQYEVVPEEPEYETEPEERAFGFCSTKRRPGTVPVVLHGGPIKRPGPNCK